MRILVISGLLLVSIHNLFAQVDERKKALEFCFAISNASAMLSGSLYLPTEYIVDQNNKIIGQKYISDSFSDQFTVTNEGSLILNFFGEQIFNFSVMAPGCNRYNKTMKDFNPTYNDQNKITRLEKRSWSGYGKGIFVKDRYLFEYAGDQLVKLSKITLIGEGTSVSSAATVLEYTDTESTITWKSEGEVTITSTTYRSRRKKTDPTVVNYTRTYDLAVEKGKVRKSTTPDQTYEAIAAGKEVTVTTTNTKYKSKNVTVYKHDDKNLVVFITSSKYENEQLTEKLETTITYVSKDSGKAPEEICNLQTKTTTDKYDGHGNLTQQNSDQGVRVKNQDGSWGPWKAYTY
jgi:hypothetical protein